MKKALITGASGFVGKHLKRELQTNSYSVVTTDIHGADVIMDITDYKGVRGVVDKYKPDYIFHLAGIAFVPSSWQDPELVFKVNALGSLNLFNAVRSVGINPVIQIAGSSEEYGLVKEDELPIKETNPLRPLSPYAVSKIAMDMLGYQYFKSYGLKIIRTRAFNHTGYGRGEQYMTSSFCKQLVEIDMGIKQDATIYHGDLTSERDFTDVRDMVSAYRLAVEKCEPGEVYNIGSGKRVSGFDVMNIVKSLVDFSVLDDIDEKRMRPSDVKILQCDATKFMAKTGWKPKYSLSDSLGQCVKYWREVYSGKNDLLWEYVKQDMEEAQ